MIDGQEVMNSNQAIREALAAIEEKMRRLNVARISLLDLLDDEGDEIAQANSRKVQCSPSVELWQRPENGSPKVIELDSQIEEHFKGKVRWTVSHVLEVLHLNPDQRGTVWNAISRLMEAGKVQMVEAGAGRRPGFYSWTEMMEIQKNKVEID